MTQQALILSTYVASLPRDLAGRTVRPPCGQFSAKMLMCDLTTLPKRPMLPLHSSTVRILPHGFKIASDIMYCHVWETKKQKSYKRL